jgi:hypothetical protein
VKPKQTERLPLDIPPRRPSWELSEREKKAGKHWLPIARKRLEEAIKPKGDDNGVHKD